MVQPPRSSHSSRSTTTTSAMGTKNNEVHPPPRDTEVKRMYRDADEVESFRADAPVLTGRL
jgi:hypothetical protein